MDRKVKRLKQSCIPIIKVRWNYRRGPEFTWEREDQFRKKYPHLFTMTAPSTNAPLIGEDCISFVSWILVANTHPTQTQDYQNPKQSCIMILHLWDVLRRQKKRGLAPERNKAIYEEVEELVDAGIMKEVHYPSWLSNPVMVKKHDEVYVDDLVIKSCIEQEVIRDIKETFKTHREINMKLNPKKCTFKMREGMFLGNKVNADGLKVCLDKVEAVLSFPSPKCLKDVQRLNGKLSSLNRFLSKSAEKSLPFFKTLKKYTKKSDFQLTAKAAMAFKQMKTLIAELPMLTAKRKRRIGHILGGCQRSHQCDPNDGKGRKTNAYILR
nr:reverse transcriptase domain-containing protein [Tanacetum cinerariifolium]